MFFFAFVFLSRLFRGDDVEQRSILRIKEFSDVQTYLLGSYVQKAVEFRVEQAGIVIV